MKKIVLIILLSSAVLQARSQVDLSPPDIEIRVEKKKSNPDIRDAIMHFFSKNTKVERWMNSPRDSIYLTAVALSFDSCGHMDTLLFSKRASEHTRDLHGLNNRLVELFKAQDWTGFGYKNKLLLLPILFVQMRGNKVDMDRHNFLSDYLGLWPDLESVPKERRLILLSPYINYYGITATN